MHGSKRLIISIISYSSNTNLTYRPGNLNLSGVLEVGARRPMLPASIDASSRGRGAP